MTQSRLRLIAAKLGVLPLKCEYSSRCVGFSKNSATCTSALDKTYCGKYRAFAGITCTGIEGVANE
jgi:hypothetical protein